MIQAHTTTVSTKIACVSTVGVGCLISVTSQARYWGNKIRVTTNAVSFAHYTVLEFLDSARIRSGPASCFAVDKELVKLEFAKMVLMGALNTKHIELWDPEVINNNFSDTYAALEEEFDLYSIPSSMLVVRKWGPKLSTDADLGKLTFALFDVTKPHFEDFRTATEYISDTTDFFLDHDFTCPWEFWNLCWTQPPGNTEVQTLLNIMLSEEEIGNNGLGHRFIQSIHAGSWLQSSFALEFESWALTDYDADDRARYKFEGTIVELLGLLTSTRAEQTSLNLFLEFAIGFYDPSRVLLFMVAWHDHDRCKDNCVLQRLLELRADPNGHGYRICPLQIATVTWNLEAVKILLEAGADPNHNGDREGYVWEEGTIPALFNDVLDRSPLNIAETMACFFSDDRIIDRFEAQPRIVALLQQHGARNFAGPGDLSSLFL